MFLAGLFVVELQLEPQLSVLVAHVLSGYVQPSQRSQSCI